MTEAQLMAFAAVAEHGSFREAAARLHLTQPGVSRAVQALERELRATLFVRRPGTVSLTPIGERLLARSRTILTEAAAMRQDVDHQSGITTGRVRLGSMPSVSGQVLPAILAALDHRHPGVEVTVLDGHDDELVTWARDGTVDLAVVAGEHRGLSSRPLLTDQFLAVLPASHPLATGSAVTPGALTEWPFILTRAGCERLVLAVLERASATPDVHHEVTEASAILAMVREGLGVSIIPGLAAPDPPPGTVLLPLDPPAERQLVVAHSSQRTLTPASAAVLDEVERWRRSRRAPAVTTGEVPELDVTEAHDAGATGH